MTVKTKVIVDCDPGIDDLSALVFILADESLDLIAVTTVAGNTNASQVAFNTRKILNFCGRSDIPVHVSSDLNMLGNIVETDGYFGADGMGNIKLENVNNYKVEQLSSASALVHYTNKYPNEVVLIAIGPLTNLPIAQSIDPSFMKNLKDLFIMCGDRSHVTIKNCCDCAEFNARCDPVAAKYVFKNFVLSEDRPLKVIDWKFCLDHPLPTSFAEEYFGATYPEKRHPQRGELLNLVYPMMKTKLSPDGMVTADPFTVYVAFYSNSKSVGERYKLACATIDGDKHGHVEFDKDPEGNIFFYDKIDLNDFMKRMLKSVQI